MSSAVSAKIKAELGVKLPYPTKVMWNSFYDALLAISKIFLGEDKTKMCKLRTLLDSIPGLERFNTQDIEIIKEYVEVMSPVSQALDILQSEKYAYTGGLLPTIYGVQNKLRTMKNRTTNTLKFMKPVATRLLEALKTRFDHLFDDYDLLLGTAFNPGFKIYFIQLMKEDKVPLIKQKMVQELKSFVDQKGDTSGSSDEDEVKDSKKPVLWQDLMTSKKVNKTQEKIDVKLLREVDAWIKPSDQTIPNIHMFPQEHRKAWLGAFIKYNTSIPSSAAVERLFSTGSNIMRPKRNRLTSLNFELLVFLKGNSKLLES